MIIYINANLALGKAGLPTEEAILEIRELELSN